MFMMRATLMTVAKCVLSMSGGPPMSTTFSVFDEQNIMKRSDLSLVIALRLKSNPKRSGYSANFVTFTC